jgi:hypothetical protein
LLDCVHFELKPLLRELDLRETVCDRLPEAMLHECKELRRIEFSRSVRHISQSCIHSSGVEFIDLSVTVITTIGVWAFALCRYLREVVLPVTLGVIGDGCFCYSGVRRVDLVRCRHLWRVGRGAWKQCERLREVVLPACIAECGDGLFAECKGIMMLELGPPGVGGNNPLRGAGGSRGCIPLIVMRSAEDVCLKGAWTLMGLRLARCGAVALGRTHSRPLPPVP